VVGIGGKHTAVTSRDAGRVRIESTPPLILSILMKKGE
jgi:hypothetical protein